MKNNQEYPFKNAFLFLALFFSMCVLPHTHAEKFDQNYLQWKAKQQARDEQLKRQDPNYYLGKPTVSNHQTSKQANSAGAAVSGAKININTANVQQLQQLNGVGEKKAQAILEYRQQNGKFKNIDELQNIKGIGPKLLEKNRTMIVL
ncbi:ComEA family DNA-binding protein [Acinetobacter piscicola]|uniref:ComEA family DNA-binding protein n=1 Tax=Acinetobacter piscicola TaxID=2006115 RepID=UPI0026AA10ED